MLYFQDILCLSDHKQWAIEEWNVFGARIKIMWEEQLVDPQIPYLTLPITYFKNGNFGLIERGEGVLIWVKLVLHNLWQCHLQVCEDFPNQSCILFSLELKFPFQQTGNEEVLPGYEIEDQLTDYFQKFSSKSAEECQMECKSKYFCRAW